MSTPETEVRAREMGWVPKDQYKGAPDRWLDAEAYVKKGDEMIPFLRANNRKQQEEISRLNSRLQENERLLRANDAALKELQSVASTQTIEAAESSRENLIDGIAKAREAGDVRREEELRSSLNNTDQKIREARAKTGNGSTSAGVTTTSTTTTGAPVDYTQTDAWKSFQRDEPWLFEDTVAMATCNGILMKLNAEGKTAGMTPEQRFALAAAETKKYLGRDVNSRREAPRRVEPSRPSGEGSSEGEPAGKTYSDLPPDAKAACDRQARNSQLVGKDKKYKTTADYQKYYVSMYFGEG